ETEPGWAVEDDEVVERSPRRNGFHKGSVQIRCLPLALVRNVEAGQDRARRDDVNVRKRRPTDESLRLDVGGGVEEPLHPGLRLLWRQKRTAEVPLRIGVDGEEPLSL